MIINCTKEEPWTKKAQPGDRVIHQGAARGNIGTIPIWRCPNCDEVWRDRQPSVEHVVCGLVQIANGRWGCLACDVSVPAEERPRCVAEDGLEV